MFKLRLKQILKYKNLTIKDVYKFTKYTREGLERAINNETIQFKEMLHIADEFDINLNQFRKSENVSILNESEEKYEKVVKTYVSKDEICKIYDERIKDLQEQNKQLQGQIQFLQQIITNNTTSKEAGSRSG